MPICKKKFYIFLFLNVFNRLFKIYIKIWNIFIDELCLTSCVECKKNIYKIFVMKTEGIKDMGRSKVLNQTEQSWHNLEFISASSGAGLRNPNAVTTRNLIPCF